MATATRINGWLVLLRPEFALRYADLRQEALRLQATLSQEEFRQHPTVKLAAAVQRLVTQIVPQDPNRPEFQLSGDLAPYRRAKKHGLPPRYRLFWIFSSSAKVIIFLYLNDQATLRKEGDRHDPYENFERMVHRGEIGPDFASNFASVRDQAEALAPEADAKAERHQRADTVLKRLSREAVTAKRLGSTPNSSFE